MKATKKKGGQKRKPVERRPAPASKAPPPKVETLPAVRKVQRTAGMSAEKFVERWSDMKAVYRDLVGTRFLPDSMKTPEQAMAVVLAGKELGIGPMTSIRRIHIIQGSPTLSPELMWAIARRSGKLAWNRVTEQTKEKCTIELKRTDEPHWHVETFTIAEAREMKTQEKQEDGTKKTVPLAEKFNWRTMPAVMLYSRCSSRILRRFMPDVINLYTPEEMEDTLVEESGPSPAPADDADRAEAALANGDAKKEIAPGADGRIFDCTKEVADFKNYAGMKWVELPDGFLVWLVKNATKGDAKVKAEATIAYKRSIDAQRKNSEGPSPIDAAFGPIKPSEPADLVRTEKEEAPRPAAPKPEIAEVTKEIIAEIDVLAGDGDTTPESFAAWVERERSRINAAIPGADFDVIVREIGKARAEVERRAAGKAKVTR